MALVWHRLSSLLMNSYRELEIFHESRKLAKEVHLFSLALPKFELFEEGQQVRRSSKAVTIAIVEGFARRRYKNDFVKHLIYSQAECDETLIHLEFIGDAHPEMEPLKRSDLSVKYDKLSRSINRFTTWVEKHYNYRS